MKDLPLNYTITVSEEMHVLTWLQSLLRGQFQQMHGYSTPCDVISGVPQGSCSPGSHTIFNLYK